MDKLADVGDCLLVQPLFSIVGKKMSVTCVSWINLPARELEDKISGYKNTN